MAEPVRWVFQATGQNEIKAAYRGIREEAVRAKQASESFGKSAAASTRASAAAGRIGADPAAKAAERVAAAQERVAKRAADAEVRNRTRAMDHVARIRERHYRDEQRRDEARDKRAVRSAEVESKARITTGKRSAASLGRLADRGATIAAGLGAAGLGVVGAAARGVIATGDLARRGSINAGLAGQKVDPKQLQRTFENVAIARPGTTSESVGEAFLAFQSKTGEVSDKEMLDVFAKHALGGGGDMGEIAGAAAAIKNQFKITSAKDMDEALSVVLSQGASGEFELADMASLFAKMGAGARRFGMDSGVAGVAKLGGMAQMARGTSGSSEAAAFAVEASMRQLVTKSADIKREAGVDVFKDKGMTKTNDYEDVVIGTIAGVKGNLPKLTKIFGDEGIRGVSPLISTFNEARNAAPASATEAEKTAAGIKAMRDAFAKATNTADAVAKANTAAASAQESSSAQLTAGWEKMKAAIAPAVEKALPSLAEAIPPVVEAFGEVAKAISAFVSFLRPDAAPDNAGEERKLRDKASGLDGQIAAAKAAGAPPEKIAELEAQKKSLTASADLAKERAWSSPAQAFGKDMTDDEFKAEFLRREDPGFHMFGVKPEVALNAAKGDGDGFGEFGKITDQATVDVFANPAQKALIEQYGIQKASEKASGGAAAPIAGAEEAQKFGAILAAAAKAVEAQAAAATSAADELKKIKAPPTASVFDPSATRPPGT